VPALRRISGEADGQVGETRHCRCHACRRTFTNRTATPLAGHRRMQAVIGTVVRWYRRDRLSAADVRNLLAERGVDVSARTVLYWIQQFTPLLVRASAPPPG